MIKSHIQFRHIVIFMCFLSACSDNSWVKSGATPQQKQEATRYCTQYAQKGNSLANIAPTENKTGAIQSSFQRCMIQKGWKYENIDELNYHQTDTDENEYPDVFDG